MDFDLSMYTFMPSAFGAFQQPLGGLNFGMNIFNQSSITPNYYLGDFTSIFNRSFSAPFYPSFNLFNGFKPFNTSAKLPDYTGNSKYSLRNSKYSGLISQIAKEEGVDPKLYLSLVQNESSFNPNANSGKAYGFAQLTPSTADYLGVNRYDVVDNLRGGARYLKEQLNTFGDIPRALAAYNAGPGAVNKSGGIPQNGETPEYVARVMATYNS